MEQLQQLKQQFYALPLKEQRLLAGTIAFVLIMLFYLLAWEPMHMGLQDEKQKQQSQQEIMIWMQQAAVEARALRSSGKRSTIRDRNKPTTLVIEQAINNAGLKSSVSKIESSGKNGARVTLKEASFNQVLVWLNTLATHNGIQVVSANIERSDKAGRADARLTFERP
ncbi:MAG: type II secretion system protein M [Proteobacteria bacterium]|nr:type II secretion system protein M [Pseudomonadota bacterium]